MSIKNNNVSVIEAITKLKGRTIVVKGKKYETYFIYVPSDLKKDPRFPFARDDEILLRIDPDNKRLIIEKPPRK